MKSSLNRKNRLASLFLVAARGGHSSQCLARGMNLNPFVSIGEAGEQAGASSSWEDRVMSAALTFPIGWVQATQAPSAHSLGPYMFSNSSLCVCVCAYAPHICVHVCVCARMCASHLRLVQTCQLYESRPISQGDNFLQLLWGLRAWCHAGRHVGPWLLSA